MLDEHTRTTILKLHEAGHGKRAIARALRLSRGAVRKVIASGSAEISPLSRAQSGENDRVVRRKPIARSGEIDHRSAATLGGLLT